MHSHKTSFLVSFAPSIDAIHLGCITSMLHLSRSLSPLSLPLSLLFLSLSPLSLSLSLSLTCSLTPLLQCFPAPCSFMLSCLGYPECRCVQFFPDIVANVKPDSSQMCDTVSEVYMYMYAIILYLSKKKKKICP